MDKIEINENARKFILDKKVDAITIKMERAGGWFGCTYMPTVNVGTPRDTREYDSYEIDGIKVYVSPSVNIEDGLRVVTSGFMFLKGLAVVPIKS